MIFRCVCHKSPPTRKCAAAQRVSRRSKMRMPKNIKMFSLLSFFFRVGFVWVIYPDVIHLYLSPHHTYTRIQSNFQLMFFFTFFDSFSKRIRRSGLKRYFLLSFENRNITHKTFFDYYWILKRIMMDKPFWSPSSQTFPFREKKKIKKSGGD